MESVPNNAHKNIDETSESLPSSMSSAQIFAVENDKSNTPNDFLAAGFGRISGEGDLNGNSSTGEDANNINYHESLSTSSSARSPQDPIQNPEPSYHVIECDGYTIEASASQRKYNGWSAYWDGMSPIPGLNCELYCGKIPKDILETELIPLFKQYGDIWDLRLMMNAFSYQSRGYAFVKYTTHESAKAAIDGLNNLVLRPGTKAIQVEFCKPKVKLFIGNIPKAKGKEELFEEFAAKTKNLKDVIIYKSPEDKKKNRGFCFLEYDSHASAFIAKKLLTSIAGSFKLWGCEIIVDWADPLEEPEDEIMCQVKILYIRNLTSRVTEDRLEALFSTFGVLERVKRIKDFAFVHFQNREEAEKAMRELQGEEFCGTNLEITWAKPPIDKQKKEEILRARERRMYEVQYGNDKSRFSPSYNLGPYGPIPNYLPQPQPYLHHDEIIAHIPEDGYFGFDYSIYYPQQNNHSIQCQSYVSNDTTYYAPPTPPRNSLPQPFSAAGAAQRTLAFPPRHFSHGDTLSPFSNPPPLPSSSQAIPKRRSYQHNYESFTGSSNTNFINHQQQQNRESRPPLRRRPRDPFQSDIVDNDDNWRANSGPSMISQLPNSPHTMVFGNWRRRE